MNNDNKSIVVLVGMVFLTIMIALPPLFRVLFPKEVEDDSVTELVEVLSCERIISNSDYAAYSEIIYKNGRAEQNQITYKKVDYSAKVNAQEGNLPPEEESAYFSKIPGINIVNNNDEVVVTITPNILNQNKDDETLSNYLQEMDKEEKFYSELGYSCAVDTK